jgi:hypothetical protein
MLLLLLQRMLRRAADTMVWQYTCVSTLLLPLLLQLLQLAVQVVVLHLQTACDAVDVFWRHLRISMLVQELVWLLLMAVCIAGSVSC